MKKHAVWLLLVVSVGLNAGLLLALFGRGHHRPPQGPPDWGRELGLSAEQQQAFDQAREKLMAALDSRRDAMQAEHEKLSAELLAEHPDRAAIDACLDRAAALQREQQADVVEHVLAVRELLTPAQRQEFVQRVLGPVFRMGPPDGRHGRGHGGPERGGWRGGPPEPGDGPGPGEH